MATRLRAFYFLIFYASGELSREYAGRKQQAAEKAAAQQRITTSEIAKECFSLESFERTICVGEALKAQHETEREYDDLNAQWTMAHVAFWLYVATAFQVVLSIGGIYYVARSLDKSAEAVKLTRQALVAENRPWVTLDPKVDRIRVGQDVTFDLDLEFTNIGRSPAFDVVVNYRVFVSSTPAHNEIEFNAFARTYLRVYERGDDYAGSDIMPGEVKHLRASKVAFDSYFSADPITNGSVVEMRPQLFVCVCYRSSVSGTTHQSARAYDFTFKRRSRLDPGVIFVGKHGDIPRPQIGLGILWGGSKIT